MKWDRLIEEQIRAAQEEGKFDNLSGKGRPLRLDENPFEDPAWQTANHLLKENGFRPEWLEADVDLRAQWERAREALVRAKEWCAAQTAECAGRADPAAIQQRAFAEEEWTRSQARFREALAGINKAIARLNLIVPSAQLHRRLLDVEVELQRLTR